MAPQYLQLNMGHRNRVEGDGATAAELKWSGVLLSVVHGDLVVVPRAAAVVVAVLIAYM